MTNQDGSHVSILLRSLSSRDSFIGIWTRLADLLLAFGGIVGARLVCVVMVAWAVWAVLVGMVTTTIRWLGSACIGLAVGIRVGRG